MMKIWSGVFWSPAEPQDERVGAPGPPGGPHRRAGPDGRCPPPCWSPLSLAIAVAAGPLYALSERAAHDLLDPSSYIRAVLG